jgi:AcrR family transcriptional regulator
VAALTVAEVVRLAESSVGAFYARFPDKDALLVTLHERSCGEALATTELALDPARWKTHDLPRVILELVRFTEAQCRQREGLLTAFISLAAADEAFARRRATLELEIAARLHRLLEERKDEVSHPDLRLAASISVRMIFGALEYSSLMHRASTASLKDLAIAPELTRAVLGYLGVEASRRQIPN